MSRQVLLSGMRPTGRLHLGNYWGALRNWVKLQERYDCYFFVADWHMLTTGYEDTSAIQASIRELVLDWLAAGVDPNRAVVFKQSDVPEHAELALLLGMITPLSWLENNPTWKEQLQELSRTKREKLLAEAAKSGKAPAATQVAAEPETETEAREELRTHGFLGYPVLQAADILLYGGQVVPVGKDQLPHLELSREIARKFNSLYGGGRPVLSEPQPLLSEAPRVPGIDGRKMSKSYGNALELVETAESLRTKVMAMRTDPLKVRANDPGHPLPCPENEPGCSVFAFHQLYSDFAPRREVECKAGQIGCVACKKDLLKSMEGPYDAFRRAREGYAADAARVDAILEEGRRKAKAAAERTMDAVRRAMRLK